MKQRKPQTAPSDQSNILSKHDLIERLHPSLRIHFTPLPKAGDPLTDEQLAAIFCGDLSALNDLLCLVQQFEKINVVGG